ncbi:MAG: glycosyltransferase family 4 protein [Thermosipho sp. (in: Bacteria)]|nr:glycosyltransferase family 4 protein [Thermosipho sp. (in: thermotogales)]
MKVLVLTNLFPVASNRNSGIFITNRLKEYVNFDVFYDAVSLTYKDGFSIRIVKKILNREFNEPLEEINGVNYITFEWNIVKKLFYNLGAINLSKAIYRDIKKKLNIEQYDIIHAHGMYGDIPGGVVAKFIAKEFKKPYIVTMHGSDINYNMEKNAEIYLDVLENASKCIFVSNALLDKAKSYGYSGENAVVIPNGYDPEVFYRMDKRKVRKELGIYKEGYNYVGFVGNLIPIKRADTFDEIFRDIFKQLSNTKFIIVGDGFLREEIEKKTKDLDIIFTGRLSQKEVAKWMNAMDVMVLPSRDEGFGAVVIEAQACGTCVVGSSNGGIPEAIGFEEYIIEEGDNFEKRFATKIVEILREGYDPKKLIERSKKFTWKRIVEKEVEVYKKAIFKNVNIKQ